MKTSRISVLTIFTLLVSLSILTPAEPLGTAFTYQGQLVDANEPANGLYDLQFSLYDAATEGTVVGSAVDKEDINVTDGYITVELDFGSVFDGNNRWLEISVRPGDISDPNAYVFLTPRQKITPAPYALYAKSMSAPLTLTANASAGTAVLSVGAMGDGVAIGASSPNGDFAVLGKDNTAVWGNSPSGFAGYFSGKGYFSDNVGIGTTSPAQNLEVEGGVFIDYSGSAHGLDAGVALTVDGKAGKDILQVRDTGANTRLVVNSSGNVGIGTSSPSAKLEVAGQVKITGGSPGTGKVLTSDAAGLASWQVSSAVVETDPTVLASVKDGVSWGEVSGIPAGFSDGIDDVGGGADTDWIISGNNMYSGVSGNVGIGDTNPLEKLVIAQGGNLVFKGAPSDAGDIIFRYSDGTQKGRIFSEPMIGQNKLYLSSDDNVADITIDADGNVGIGTIVPSAKLEVLTTATGVKGIYGRANSTTGGEVNYGIYGEAANNYTSCFGGYFVATTPAGIGIYAEGGSGYAASFKGKVSISDYTTGNVVMTLGAGLDYAEGFNVSDKDGISPGTVLVIDRQNPGKLAVSQKAYDKTVAGIAAGAKGLTSGVRLGVEGFDCDVALAGRVYCNVDATENGIEPGDMLTTSDKPGYAMKADDSARASGTILGKAMEPLEKGKQGQILVLVTLQ